MRFHAPEGGPPAARCVQTLAGCLLCALILSSICSAQTSSSVGMDRSDALSRLKEARALREKGLDREGRRLYESLLPELRRQNNEAGLAEALNALSAIANGQGEYELAIGWAR